MAEIVGSVASIAALIELTGKVTALGYSYISKVKRAPKDISELVKEFSSLGQILIDLKDFADRNPQSTALQKLNNDGGALRECLEALRELQEIMEQPRKGPRGWIGRLKWPMKERDTQQYIQRIERQKGYFILALAIDQITMTAETKLSIEAQTAEKAAEKRGKILDWLYSGDPYQKHTEITRRRHPNTGTWILKAPEFQGLHKKSTPENPSILWGFGIPGAGKTFLSSIAIDHFRAAVENYGVAYIYFDYKEQQQQKPLHILSSLVKQLSSHLDSTPADILSLYNRLSPTRERPSFEELYLALIATFESFDKVFMVFDALDECHPEHQRKELLQLFHRLARNGVGVFVTSRHHPLDIQASFKGVPWIEMEAKRQDVETYIRQVIDEDFNAKRLIQDREFQEEIVDGLVECAQGMFLIVRFQIEYLCQQTTAKKMLEALQKLKTLSTKERPLDATYDRAMEILRGQTETRVDLGVLVLSWLVKAQRPLTVKELRVAVSVELDRYEIDESDLPDKTTILDVCAGLVVVNKGCGTIRLAHSTVQEYLLRKDGILSDVEFKLAMACTMFLAFDIFGMEMCDYSDTSHHFLRGPRRWSPLQEYATHYLYHHLHACPEELTTGVLVVFLERPMQVSAWLQGILFTGAEWFLELSTDSAFDMPASGEDPAGRLPLHRLPLHLAASLGHLPAVRALVEKGADVSTPEVCGYTPLHRAAFAGHMEVARLLLEKGASFLPRDHAGDTPLCKAASRAGSDFNWRGKVAVLELLLESGAEVATVNGAGQTLLQQVLEWGVETVEKEALVSMLIGRGVDVLARDQRGYTALHVAALYPGNESMVPILVKNGIDIAEQDNNGWTSLHHAVRFGRVEMVRILISHGSDTSAPDSSGWTELHHAARAGEEKIVQLLVGQGVDITAVDGEGGTVLHRAARSGNKDVARLLLDRGADVSARDKMGRTVLQTAVRSGSKGMVQLLLEEGADIAVRDSYGRTALHEAAWCENGLVAQLLVERGADVALADKFGSTPLHRAAAESSKTLQLLLSKAPHDAVSTPDNDGLTPLHHAAHSGSEKAVQLLLNSGAAISTQDNDGWTPLHHGARSGNDKILQLLLAQGVDVDTRDDEGWTALHHAARAGDEGAVRALVERGADVQAVDGQGRTAVVVAQEEGREVLRVLMEAGG